MFNEVPDEITSYEEYSRMIKDTLLDEGKFGEVPEYTGRILAVGIAYNKNDPQKSHECKVDVLREKFFEILYIIFDYSHKHYTFKQFEV